MALTKPTADQVVFTPTTGLSATNVQTALAETVVYTPSGSGAVSTTNQTKLRQVVTIADYGDSLTTAFTALGGAEGTGYGALPTTIDLLGKTITFVGTVYVPINVSLINGKVNSVSGRLVFRNPHLANTALRGYAEYWPSMKSSNQDVAFTCIVVINTYIGAKFRNCDFNGLVFVNSNELWTEYNSFDRCAFTQNTTIGAAIRFDGNKNGLSTYSTGTGAGTSDGSFGYNNFESNCRIDSTAPQVGIAITNGAVLYNAHLGFQGYARGAGLSGGFMFIDSSINVSGVTLCTFEVHLESFGAAAIVLSINANSQFWYNTGSIYSASPEMIMSQDAAADLRANAISVVGVTLQDSGGAAVFNGAGYMTKMTNHLTKREWAVPAFAATPTTDQTVVSDATTLITLGTEEFDTNSNFSSSRFMPTVAGYYQINAQARFAATATVSSATLHLYRSGLVYRSSDTVGGLGITTVRSISTLVYLNGINDYVEIWAHVIDTAAAPVVKAGTTNTFLNGCLMRSA